MMSSTGACLACALDQIPSTHPDLESARVHLSIAVECANNYYKTWHSIIWIRSNTSTKTRVQQQLNELAFDCFTHFLLASGYLDRYAEFMDSQGIKPTRWWGEMNCSLSLAYSAIQRENSHQIYCKQLRLIT